MGRIWHKNVNTAVKSMATEKGRRELYIRFQQNQGFISQILVMKLSKEESSFELMLLLYRRLYLSDK